MGWPALLQVAGATASITIPRGPHWTRGARVSNVVMGMEQAGSQPRLIVLRGNSASGKSTVAAQIRARHGRGIAIVAQDNLRRIVLRERDVPGGANIGLIEQVARYALDAGYHTIVEGIFSAARYGPMLQRLADSHAPSHLYYLDVPFEETVRRHAGKPQAAEYGRAEMSQWYRDKDLLPGGAEAIIPADSSLENTVQRIMRDTGLTTTAAPAASA